MDLQISFALLLIFFPSTQAKNALPITLEVQRDVEVKHNIPFAAKPTCRN